MQVRLAFSLMLQARANILLVDEVLAVGDLAFQEKCIASLDELKRGGTTVVLVTHDMDAVQRHCDRALLIEGGVVEAIGDPAAVAARYLDLLFPYEGGSGDPRARGEIAAFTRAWISNDAGEVVEFVPETGSITVNLAVRAKQDVSRLQVQLELINNPEGVTVATLRAGDDDEIGLAADDEIVVRFAFEPGILRAGVYRFNYILGTPDRAHLLDHSREALPLRVVGDESRPGLVRLEHSVTVDRHVAGRSG
jgi:Wzt C-terminal domain